MLVDAELATAATWDAARADDLDSAWFAAAVAAAHAIRAQVFNAQNNIQLHGGIGFTWEHDAHLYLRRARTLAALMADGGDPLLDVVEGQRSGQAHGASFTLPAGSRGVPRQGARGRGHGPVAARRPAAGLPRRVRLPGAALARALGARRRCPRATRHRGGVRRRPPPGHGDHRLGDADDRPGGHRRPARALGGTGAARPGDVVPAVLRAGRGVGRRGGAHVGQEGRRRLAGHRAEGVDEPGPPVPVGAGDGTHRPRRPEARRCDDDGDRHEAPKG